MTTHFAHNGNELGVQKLQVSHQENDFVLKNPSKHFS